MTEQDKRGTNQAMLSTPGEILERVVIGGDLSNLKPVERVMYYRAVCESVWLNPLTKPFEFLYLQNKMVLYARKEATEQLRQRHGVSVISVISQVVHDTNEEMVVVTATGRNKEGREDTATGVVSLGGLHGEQRANAYMKAETKAKRRLTLSLCGLGVRDESEIEIPLGAVRSTETVVIPHAAPLGKTGLSISAEEHTVETLFPTPENDRAGLMQRAKIARLQEAVDRLAADARDKEAKALGGK